MSFRTSQRSSKYYSEKLSEIDCKTADTFKEKLNIGPADVDRLTFLVTA